MTLVIGLIARETIWLLADRRLSIKGRQPRDDARKILTLETSDGIAIAGYAGLGKTQTTEPSEWMARAVRQLNLPLEQVLSHLAATMQAQLPKHMRYMLPGESTGHHVIIPAFINGEASFYSIQLNRFEPGSRYAFKFERMGQRPPRIFLAGSGGPHLLRRPHRVWSRRLLRLAAAHDQGKISPAPVAKALAELNAEVAQADTFVSAESIVIWRYRKEGPKGGGGGQEVFKGSEPTRTAEMCLIPAVANGMHVSQLIEAILPITGPALAESLKTGAPPADNTEQINKAIARLKWDRDETLR